jgi:hypothetical protein
MTLFRQFPVIVLPILASNLKNLLVDNRIFLISNYSHLMILHIGISLYVLNHFLRLVLLSRMRKSKRESYPFVHITIRRFFESIIIFLYSIVLYKGGNS